jgi:UDP-N-acetylglucosamine 2-epimerase (non-hydrolysing)
VQHGHVCDRAADLVDLIAPAFAAVDGHLTDSGGLQEEAPTFRVPLLVLRDETERPEAMEAGCAVLVGTSRRVIVAEIERLWHDQPAYRRMQSPGNPFGDGTASPRIVASLERHFSTVPAAAVAAA